MYLNMSPCLTAIFPRRRTRKGQGHAGSGSFLGTPATTQCQQPYQASKQRSFQKSSSKTQMNISNISIYIYIFLSYIILKSSVTKHLKHAALNQFSFNRFGSPEDPPTWRR